MQLVCLCVVKREPPPDVFFFLGQVIAGCYLKKKNTEFENQMERSTELKQTNGPDRNW